MIEDILKEKYGEYLDGLDIYENPNSITLSRIVIKKDLREKGLGKQIMTDLVSYADQHKKTIVLTPSSDFGGNVNRLVQFYKGFGFVPNKGKNKNFEFRDTMIRSPKINENMKPLIKQLLREAILSKDEKDIRIVSDFINFAKDFLGIDDGIKVDLAFERTPDLKTTAYYNLLGHVKVYAKDRAIIDVCRSIAHELVHHKQNLEGRITQNNDGDDGSPIENEANAVAGVIIRKYGKINPSIYI